MDKKSSRVANFIKKEVQKSCLGILGILRDAFNITINRIGSLALFITFIIFSYYSSMGFVDHHHLVWLSLLRDLAANFILLVPKNVRINAADPTLHEAIVRDVRYDLVTYKLVTLSFLFLVLVFSVEALVRSTYEVCSAAKAKVVSLVVYVTEGNYELMKGKRLQGFVLMIVQMFATGGAMYLIFYFMEAVGTTEFARLVGLVISVQEFDHIA